MHSCNPQTGAFVLTNKPLLGFDMLVNLPTELLKLVLDHLRPVRWEHGHVKKDLRSMTLVCRQLKHDSQSYLFKDIVYTFRCAHKDAHWELGTSMQLFNQRVEGCTYPNKTLPMPLSFLQDHPSFDPMVRRLRLIALPEHAEDIIESEYGDCLNFRDSDVVDISLWRRLLASMPRVEELEVADIKLRSSQEYWASHKASLPSLNRLLVEYPYYSPISDSCITEILDCFDFIKAVEVFNSDLDELPNDSYSPCSVGIQHFSLVNDTRTTGQLFQFLLRSPSAYTLCSLDIAFVSPSTTAPVGLANLLRAVGHRLDHFACHVTPRYPTRAEDDFAVPDLPDLSSLRSLTLRIFHESTHSPEVAWARCALLLSQCRVCSLLATVNIRLSIGDSFSSWEKESAEPMQRFEETVLDVVSRTSLSRLVTTTANQAIRRPKDLIRDHIAKCMPRLVEMGILSFAD